MVDSPALPVTATGLAGYVDYRHLRMHREQTWFSLHCGFGPKRGQKITTEMVLIIEKPQCEHGEAAATLTRVLSVTIIYYEYPL